MSIITIILLILFVSTLILFTIAIPPIIKKAKVEIISTLEKNNSGESDKEHTEKIQELNNTIKKDIGILTEKLNSIKTEQNKLQTIFTTPTERGAWGETALESILSDQLPPDLYTIRKKISELKLIPDATIQTPQGKIIIDSKFPLTNYIKAISPEYSKEEQKLFLKAFKKDFKKHCNKVKKDYVSTHSGLLPFALVYIPSESVYTYAVENLFEELKVYATEGIIVVGPLTLAQKVTAIKAGLNVQVLSEKTKEVQKNLSNLNGLLKKLQTNWEILFNTHLSSLNKKSEEINTILSSLINSFNSLED